jgi:sulfur carrier protein
MRVVHRDTTWEIDGKRKVRDIIRELDLNPHTVLAVRDGKLLTEDALVGRDDEVKLVPVISGG